MSHGDTFALSGETNVRRLGFGAMRITGPGIWGEPADPAGARALLQRVVQAGAPAQVALAWLLHHSPVMLPIPGTGSIEHFEENLAAAEVELSDEKLRALELVAVVS